MKIEEYLSEEKKQEIATEVFKDVCYEKLTNDFERIFSNCAYENVRKMVNESIDSDLEELIKTNTIRVINDLSTYTVFNDKVDSWSKNPLGTAYQIMEKTIKDNKELLASRTLACLSKMDAYDVQKMIRDLFTLWIKSRKIKT